MKTSGSIGKFVGFRGLLMIGLVVGLSATMPAGAAGIYVSTNGTQSADYDTWANAFANLQDALDYAASEGGVTTIYVAGQIFWLTNQIEWATPGITIRGGYEADPNGDSPGNHDPELWPTVLARSGAFNHRIMSIDGADNSRLEHVTLTGGYLTDGFGGGLSVSDCTGLTLAGCAIVKNGVSYSGHAYGGGLYLSGSDVVVSNSLVAFNDLYVDLGSRYGYGGGIASDGTLLIRDSVLLANKITSQDDRYYNRGGGLYFNGTSGHLKNVLVALNAVQNCSQRDVGAGLHVNADTHLANCTVFRNVGYGIVDAGSVSNSIVWGNGKDILGASTVVSFSNIGDMDFGGNNLSVDPLFERGFYLASESLCRHAGSAAATNLGMGGYAKNADGDSYADQENVHLGYHYRTGLISAIADLYVATSGDDANSGTTTGEALRTITRALTLARDGTRIHVAGGTYGEGETFPLGAEALAGVQIIGQGSEETVIDATGVDSGVMSFSGCANLVLSGMTVTGGQADRSGGGLALSGCTAVLDDCRVVNNHVWRSAWVNGGGIYATGSDLVFKNGMIVSNSVYFDGAANNGGGGIYTDWRLRVLNSTIAGNEVDKRHTAFSARGGGVFLRDAGGSGADGNRGSRFYFPGVHVLLRNVLVAHNVGGNNKYPDVIIGGGLHLSDKATLENVTVVDNNEWGIVNVGSVNNAIVWGNEKGEIATTISVTDVSHSNIGTGGYPADEPDEDGNISADPLFVDALTGNYRLQTRYGRRNPETDNWIHDAQTSPCIDAGTNLDWHDGGVDLDGAPRLQRGRYETVGLVVDMGAYEQTYRPRGTIFFMR